MEENPLGLSTRRWLSMWRRFTLALAASSFAAACASTSPPRPTSLELLHPYHPGSPTIRVRVGEGASARIRVIPLEDYVVGSVLAELPLGSLAPAAAERMAQVQAVLARTYALANLDRHAREGFNLCATTHCQLFRPVQAWASETFGVAQAAAEATSGLVILYEQRPIQALFHSDCGGHTSAAGLVWGGPTPPYLRAVADTFCSTDRAKPWRFAIGVHHLRDALNQDVRTHVGARLDRIAVVERDEGGRASRVVLDGERAPMVRGEEFRAVLAQRFGAHSLRSTRFTVRRQAAEFVFQGRGYGHGVGLCQTGAIARARAGHSLQEIIQHYYPGTSLDHARAVVQQHTSRGRGQRQVIAYN